MLRRLATALALSLLGPAAALAAEPELVTVRTDGTTTTLQAGESGRLVLRLEPAPGAHVNQEAPVKVELSSREARFERPRLGLADARLEGGGARFEARFTPSVQGPISLQAAVSFYACTATTCARQSRTVSVPVEVR